MIRRRLLLPAFFLGCLGAAPVATSDRPESKSSNETAAPLRKVSFRIEGRGDLSSSTVVIKNRDIFLAVKPDGTCYDPLGSGGEVLELSEGTYEIEIEGQGGRSAQKIVLSNGSPARFKLLAPVSGARARSQESRKLDNLSATSGSSRDGNFRTVLTAAEARTMPGTAGDPVRAVLNFPSVAPQSIASTALYVRGGGSGETAFLFDGLPIGDVFHNLGFYSVFPANAIDRIDFWPGAYGAKYGNAQSAVIEVNSKSDFDKTRLKGDFDANLAVATAFVTFPIGKHLQLSLGGRRTYYEFYLSLIKSIKIPALAGVVEALTSFDTIPFFYDYTAKIDWQPATGHRIELVAIGAQDKLTINTDKFPDLGGSNGALSFAFNQDRVWDTQGLIYTLDTPVWQHRFAVGHYDYTNNTSLQGLSTSASRRDWWSASARIRLSPRDGISFAAGSDWLYQIHPFTFADFPPGSNSFSGFGFGSIGGLGSAIQRFNPASAINYTKEAQRHVLTPWAEFEIPVGKMVFTPGLRVMWNSVSQRFDFDPRFSFTLKASKDLDLWVRGGRYSQLPTPEQMSEDYGNPSLATPHTWQAALGGQLAFFGFEGKAEVWGKILSNQVLNNPTYDAAFRSGGTNLRFIDTGFGRAAGGEILVRRKLADRWFGWISYAYTFSERYQYSNFNAMTTANLTVNNGPDYANLGRTWLVFDQLVEHSVTGIVSVDIVPKRFKIGARLGLSSGKPYTQRIVSVSGTNISAAAVTEPLLGERYPLRFTLDVRMDWNIPLFDGKADLTIYLDIWNTQFAASYTNVQSYNYPVKNLTSSMAGQLAPREGIGDLPIIPLLGMSLTF